MAHYPYQPDSVPPPGETVAELLDVLGLSPAELAQRMGRPAAVIEDLIAGQTVLTEEMAEQLAHLLGVPAHFWRNREARYRTLLAQQTLVAPS